MHNKNTSKIEALLFAAGDPVGVDKIAKQLSLSKEDCGKEVELLGKIYEETGSGLQLVKKNGKLQLVSGAKHGEMIANFLNKSMNEPLSKAAVEVLSVVAYRGPITRAQVEHIRGVNCSFTLRNLAIRGLIEREDNPNDTRSFLYSASMDFIKSMGVEDLSQLPEYEQLHFAEIAVEGPVKKKETDKVPERNDQK